MADEVIAAAGRLCLAEGGVSKTGIPNAESSDMQLIIAHVPSQISLQTLIGQMGTYLTHEDGTTRRKATGILAALLEHAHAARASGYLVEKQDTIRVLCTFFNGRLGDYPSALPSLKALLPLLKLTVEHPGVYPTAAVAVSKAIFSNLHTQALDQAHRQAVFDIIEHILSTDIHCAALAGKPRQTDGDNNSDVSGVSGSQYEPYILDFASGFIQAMDGEKDPRCLLVCLRCAGLLLSSSGLYHLGDSIAALHGELLDVTGCYFPITFTPPPNDPHGITKDQLVQALRRVFSAHPGLAPFVIPLLLEKLGSPLTDSKRDALATLRAVAPVYGASGLVPHLVDICSLLRKEVTQSRDRENPGANATGTVTGMQSLWTGTLGAQAQAGPGRVGITAGAIGLNFSGSSDLHVNSGYGLYVPLSVSSGSPKASADAPSASPPLPLVEEALHSIAAVTRVMATAAARQSPDQAGRLPQWWMDYTAWMVRTGLTEIERAAESLLGRSCARILCAFGSANHLALRTTLDLALPVLSEIYMDAATNKRHTVRACVLACVAGLVHAVDPALDHPHGEHPLSRHAPTMIAMFTETLATQPEAKGEQAGPKVAGLAPLTEARCVAAAGLCDLCVRPPTPLLTVEQKHALTLTLSDLLVKDADDAVREACLRALCTLASIRVRFCEAVLQLAVPQLMVVLQQADEPGRPPSPVAGDANDAMPHVPAMHAHGVPTLSSRALYALSQLCAISSLKVQLTILPQLLAVAIRDREEDGVSYTRLVPHGVPGSFSLAVAVLESLARVVSIKAGVDDTPAMDALVRADEQAGKGWAQGPGKDGRPLPLLIPSLYRLVVDSVRPGPVARLPSRVCLAAEQIFRTASICCSMEQGDKLRKAAMAVLVQGQGGEADPSFPPAPWFSPLSATAPPSQLRLGPVFLKVVACTRKGAATPQAPQLVNALCDAVFLQPVGPLRSCGDSYQRARPVTRAGGPAASDAPVHAHAHAHSHEDADESVAASRAHGGESPRSEDALEDRHQGGQADASAGTKDLQRTAVLAAQCVGLVINRSPTGPELEGLLATALGHIQAQAGLQVAVPGAPAVALSRTAPPGVAVERGLLLAVWVAKALAMRGHQATTRVLDVILDVLEGAGPGTSTSSPAVLSLAASALGHLVLEPVPRHPYSKEAGATVLPTYKQRVFGQVMARYKARTDSSSTMPRLPLLLGLCSMAAHLPPALVSAEVERLSPVTVQALEIVTAPSHGMPWELCDMVALSALSTLRTLCSQPAGASAVSTHMLNLVPALIKLALHVPRQAGQDGQGGPRPLVRASAIDCLRALVAPELAGVIPYHKLHPVRQAVISGLVPALDDPRRPVRRRAAACRNDWITMSGGDPTKHR